MKRREGLSKLTGRERYVDDDRIGDGLWVATVRSPRSRGHLRGLRFPATPGVDWSEVVVLDHRAVPGSNVVKLIADDQPVLAHEVVRHRHEPVALVAHPSRRVARRAADAVVVEIDPETPALDFRTPPQAEAVQRGPDNVFTRLAIDKGDIDAAWDRAARIVEGVYETGAQEHVYLETQGMAAWVEEGPDGDVVVVRGSMQCPYYVHAAMMHALDRPAERVRVIQAPTGGGFGGKEEFPSGVALHAALVALATGRKTKLIYDRGEDLAATTKRHPSRVRHRTAVDEDGRLLAQDIEVDLDAGAYLTLSPVVLSRAIIHAAGPYACPNVRIRGRAIMTNSVPFGAFRGFGAPQSLFAVERHMDRIAATLGLDPVAVRRINLLRDGETTATGQTITDGSDRHGLLERTLAAVDWTAKQAAHRAFNAVEPTRRRGLGLATVFHGAGFTGSGEARLASVVHVAGLPDGRIEVRTAATEMGQGTLTIFTQLVCGRLGVAPDDVVIADPDTQRVPDSGPTVASRTAMIVGRLVERACDDLRSTLGLDPGEPGSAVVDAVRDWHRAHPGEDLLGIARYQPPPGIRWDDETYRGDAYPTFAWAVCIAEVEVDLTTYTAKVLDFVSAQEIGRVLNETLARGQIQGGTVQGIGWALLEDVVWEDGGMANAQMTNYVIPTSDDVPPIRVLFEEAPFPHGAQGAKGIGELPMDGPAPAIANAVTAALGVDADRIPLIPERIMDLLLDQPVAEETA